MSTMGLAMLQQASDPDGMRRLAFILFIVIAVGIAVMAVIMMYIGLKALKVIKDLGATATEMKEKFLPLIDDVSGISKISREMLEDAAPKVKTISAHLVRTSETLAETSQVAKSAVQRVEGTIIDANLRAQRQVARVDTMVSAALETTQEVADTISNGIRVPAMKLAALANQAKTMAEGLMAKIKGGASPFGGRRRPE